MSNAVLNKVSSALGYDAVETALSEGAPLAFCYDFAIAALSQTQAPVGEDALPESARTVMAATTATVIEAA